jgi:hypothetical protein
MMSKTGHYALCNFKSSEWKEITCFLSRNEIVLWSCDWEFMSQTITHFWLLDEDLFTLKIKTMKLKQFYNHKSLGFDWELLVHFTAQNSDSK